MHSANSKLRILVLGYIVRGPMGGMTWHHLQYALGLHQMGHEVYFFEDSGDTPYCCYDPARNVTDENPSYGLHYAKEVFERSGHGESWAYYDHHQQRWHGPAGKNALTIVRNTDLLFNLSGSNAMRPWMQDVPVRVLIDTDPVFTQIKNLTSPGQMAFSRAHTNFFSFGENLGKVGCSIPEDGLPWQPTRQPVVLNAWPCTPGDPSRPFTTLMKWESYPSKQYGGKYYGMKSDSFPPYMKLPAKTSSLLEIGISDRNAPRKELQHNGWLLSYPQNISADPWQYQDYIRQSKAEFSVAKHGYVEANTGWFSERSAGYLASGRPVVVQDTGFSEWISSDLGLRSFVDPAEALAAIEDINNHYAQHCNAARELASAYFSSTVVLEHLVQRSFNPATLQPAAY